MVDLRLFVRVEREQFFATIDPLNVHPRAEREASYWETPRRDLIGISTPGYLMADETGRYQSSKTYYLRKSAP